ncbi:ATP-binding protein [Perlabentimonas gracilis]|uniref:ATP-binding protein n=1 Tax=Perlabentimonas gracilis TaxID=2715279 RepID=UPI00140E4CB2|nr:AAA family ATPase [Perlabentimonas gracilis]NHB69219.1 ATP-binding protein [Perlabentimonas gracilis]
MNSIYDFSARVVEMVKVTNIRPQIEWLKQNERLIGIKGSRGVGKTTLLLQYAKTLLKNDSFVYISLDNLYFTENSLLNFADEFYKNGGKVLLIDEVHHYPNWSLELKNIYDLFPDLKVVYTGSSLLHLSKGLSDLSRRSVVYNLPGLSLREFINFSTKLNLAPISLDEILTDHESVAKHIWKETKPIKWFNQYINHGYYPFFLEGIDNYHHKLNGVILQILESDLPYISGVSYSNINKLKQLLYVISESVPFKPNIEKLSERIGISKNTLKDYLHYLNDALLISMLYSDSKGISRLTKPDKIYLHNTNLMFALANTSSNTGNERETFFYNALSAKHAVSYTQKGDFLIDGRYTFEVGGKNKSHKQIEGVENAYLAIDGIDTGYGNQIPLWLFGFIY